MSTYKINYPAFEELVRDSEKVRILDSLIRAGYESDRRTVAAIIGMEVEVEKNGKTN